MGQLIYNGKEIPSSTEGLYFESDGHKYTMDGLVCPGFTGLAKRSGIIKDIAAWGQEHRDRGHAVHAMCAMYNKMGPEALDYCQEEYLGYLEAYHEFYQSNDYDPLVSEGAYGERNTYTAGTIDIYGLLDGYLSVIDIKSGGRMKYAGLQLAHYSYLLNCNGLEVEKRYILQLKSDGNYRLWDNYAKVKYTDRIWDNTWSHVLALRFAEIEGVTF